MKQKDLVAFHPGQYIGELIEYQISQKESGEAGAITKDNQQISEWWGVD